VTPIAWLSCSNFEKSFERVKAALTEAEIQWECVLVVPMLAVTARFVQIFGRCFCKILLHRQDRAVWPSLPAHARCAATCGKAWPVGHAVTRWRYAVRSGCARCSTISKVNEKRRREALINFGENPHCAVFLLTRGTGAVGLNLTVATHIVLLEPHWNPVFEEQAISRAHRLGHKGDITVLRYLCQGASRLPTLR
jgi:hypothetical protein